MASFQAKLRWDRTGKNVNKKNKKKVKKKKTVPMSSYPTRNSEFQKIVKIFKKLENSN